MSWARVPNKPTVSVDVKQHFNINRSSRAQKMKYLQVVVAGGWGGWVVGGGRGVGGGG